MLDVKALLARTLALLDSERSRKAVKEGCTIFRQGDYRCVRLDSPSAWCATLLALDRPTRDVAVPAKVYNGSTYVDCMVLINTLGEVRVQTLYGATVSGAQYGYLRPRDISYFVGGGTA